MATILHNGLMRKLTPLLMKSFLVDQTRKGNKTQTRRLNGLEEINNNISVYNYDPPQKTFLRKDGKPTTIVVKSPYGQIGDVIWVRETWCKNEREEGKFHYAASVCSPKWDKPNSGWKPSIHMPKEACRLFLEVTDIRPERLQDITEEDAIDEGIECDSMGDCKDYLSDDYPFLYEPKRSFKSLWKLINGEDSWKSNPWVWRIQFKQIPKPANWPA
jgi:hypothetical protein